MMIIGDQELINLLDIDEYSSPLEQLMTFNKIKEKLDTISFTNRDINGIVIFRKMANTFTPRSMKVMSGISLVLILPLPFI